MNKKLIAVAVGSALGAIAAPAFAQSSTVTLSGNLNYVYGYYDNGGAGFTGTGTTIGVPKNKTDAIINSESEWVLTGQEDLGGGMAAYFRCATSLDIQFGTASNMCGRTSFVGLKGGWGSVSVGNNDTPIKIMIGLYDPFPIGAPIGQGAGMFNGTSSALGNVGSSFSRRQNSLITYSMPSMNGFDAAFAWTSANEAAAGTSATSAGKPRMYSAMVNYTNGPLSLGAGYERHIDFNPLATAAYAGGHDTSYQLGVAYTFMGSLKISAIYVNMKYDNVTSLAAAPATDAAVTTYGLYGNWAISGPHSLKAGYGSQGATKGTYAGGVMGSLNFNAGAGNTGSQKIHVEYSYAMSKRTEVSLGYARINNDRNSNLTVGTGSATANYGESQSHIGMRLNHKF